MFILPKSFEHTLRTPIIPATPAQPGSGLNPAFHKGCTGKAHACGTIKSKLIKPIPPPRGDKSQRKSSISSENISDSGSEYQNSIAGNTHDTINIDDKCIVRKGSKDIIFPGIKICPDNRSPLPPRRTSKTSPSPVLKRSSSISSTRIRLHSEGEQYSECDRHSPVPSNLTTFERTQKYRSFRTNGKSTANCKNIPATNTNIRPPWNSAAAGTKTTSSSTNSHLNNRVFRSSLRRRNDTVSWQTVWERSLHMRGSGSTSGYFKNYDEIIKKKVSM